MNPLGSPSGRHLDNGRDVLPQGSPIGRHLDSGNTILPQGSPRGRHINSGNTILPQGSPSRRHTQSPLGQGSLRKSPLESKVNHPDRKEFDLIHNKIDQIKEDIDDLKQTMNQAHSKTDESLSFMKENLFNPHEGLCRNKTKFSIQTIHNQMERYNRSWFRRINNRQNLGYVSIKK